MLYGRSFRLNTATLGVAVIDGKRQFVTVLPGSMLRVVSRCTDVPNAMVDVLVDGTNVEMFAVDVRNRSDEIRRAKAAS
jgi:hypothetical protein